MDDFIIALTFIPWILIFIVSILNNLKNKNYLSFSLNFFKRNIFKIFRLDTLLLIIAFFYFSSYEKDFVAMYLFTIICLYLFVNFFYEKKNPQIKDFYQNNIINLILIFLIMLIPFYLYYKYDNLIGTYKLMLVYLFGEYVVILIVNLISQFIKKIFWKQKVA